MPCVHIITTLNCTPPHTFSFHHFPQENFSWAVEEAVLLKEGQWLSEVGGGLLGVGGPGRDE